jgi:F420-dependent oxidoreductase-like protein
MKSELRIGIHSGQQHTTFADSVAQWRLAEELGYDWASVFDHYIPISGSAEGAIYDSFTWLAAMAASTSRIRCGIIVTNLLWRNPGVLAKIATTIDHVSAGRLELGLGAGAAGVEVTQFGVPAGSLGERMDRLDETIQILRALWTQRRTDFDGRHYRIVDAIAEPKPLQEHLPIWVGGMGERRTLRIIAERADGWNAFAPSLELYKSKLDVLEAHCKAVGRDPGEIRKQIVIQTMLGADPKEVADRTAEEGYGTEIAKVRLSPPGIPSLTCTPEQLIEHLKSFVDLGVRDILLLARPPADVRTMELFATQVAPALREHASDKSSS